MQIDIYKDDLANKKSENRLLKLALVVVSVGCVVSSYFSVQAVRFQKTIIVPSGFDSRIVIHGNDLNDGYLKHYAKYTLSLIFNYSPANFSDQGNDLLKLCTPGFYPAMRSKLLKMKESVSRLKITSNYNPKTFSVDKKNRKVIVDGTRLQSVEGREIEVQSKKYTLKYQIIDGRFYVDDIREVQKQ